MALIPFDGVLNRLTSDMITDGTIVDADFNDVAASKFTGTLPALSGANLTNLPAANFTGTLPAISGAALTGVATDLTSIRQDILALALHSAVTDNKVAYNLPSAFIDQFQDDSGLLTQTNVDRDSTGEYVSSIITVQVVNTWCIEFMFEVNSTTANYHFFDLRSNDGSKGLSIYQNDQKVYIWLNGSTEYWSNASNAVYDPNFMSKMSFTRDSSRNIRAYAGYQPHQALANRTWNTSNPITVVPVMPPTGQLRTYFGTYNNNGSAATGVSPIGQIDEWRISNVVRHSGTGTFPAQDAEYTSDSDTVLLAHGNNNYTDSSSNAHTITNSGTGFSTDRKYGSHSFDYGSNDYIYLPEGVFDISDTVDSVTANATGTLISNVQTAPAATTSLSGVILYTDTSGTATLGTDLKIYMSANNGTNFTEASSYATAQTFNGSVKMVRLGKTTVTSGTQVKLKAVWANQASGSKETRLDGWAINY